MKMTREILKKSKEKTKKITKKIKQFLNGIFNPYQGILSFHFFAFLRLVHFPYIMNKYKALNDIRNIHKGEKCFIVATGPSLTVNDIELLNQNNCITFGVNGIFRIYPRTKWRPTYYMMLDLKEWRSFRDKGFKMNFDELCKEKAILYEEICDRAEKEKSYDKIIRVPVFFTGGWLKRKILHNFIFSKNPMWGFYSMWTVTIFAIVMASYMGFSDVYLLGCDCDYSGEKKYFDNEKNIRHKDDRDEAEAQRNMIAAYQFINEHTKKLGLNIYNATRGGALEIFQRVILEDIL